MKALKIIIIVSIMTFTLTHAEEYSFGNGVQVADSPLIVGGYASSIMDLNKNNRMVSVDDVALLAYGEYDHMDFLAELETVDLYKKEFSNRRDENSSGAIHVERLYGDYFFGHNERLRIGKFNSDIGFWNQIPINVLRDTTSSPRLVSDFFPKLTTGIQYESRQSIGAVRRISVTLQNNRDLDIGFNNFDTYRHYAATCDIIDQEALWRFSGGYFQYEPWREAYYLSGAMKTEQKRWTFLLESILRRDSGEGRVAYDVYAQGVWHMRPAHDLIFRSEIEKTPLTYAHDGSAIVGYTYRPLNNIALKSEYEAHQNTLLNRWLFSFSVLF